MSPKGVCDAEHRFFFFYLVGPRAGLRWGRSGGGAGRSLSYLTQRGKACGFLGPLPHRPDFYRSGCARVPILKPPPAVLQRGAESEA